MVVSRDHGLRVEAFTERQSFTTHHDDGALAGLLDILGQAGYRQVLVQTPNEDVQLLRSASRVTTRRAPPSRTSWSDLTADRTKPYPLDPQQDKALLHALDLATPDGKILSAMADKYRQLNHLITTALSLDCLQSNTPLHVIDAGCGKAYLSIALVYVLRRSGRDATLLGIDTNPHVIDHARAVVHGLGMQDCTFIVQPLRDAWLRPAVISPNRSLLLLALHACDTATDDALMAGLTLRADAMLVAPCCHHFVQQQLSASTVPAAARPLLADGITKERLGDVLTDTMRRDIVRAFGYEAHLQEFISLEHTMKNILLKAERRRTTTDPDLRSVQQTASDWGARPKLLDMAMQAVP